MELMASGGQAGAVIEVPAQLLQGLAAAAADRRHRDAKHPGGLAQGVAIENGEPQHLRLAGLQEGQPVLGSGTLPVRCLRRWWSRQEVEGAEGRAAAAIAAIAATHGAGDGGQWRIEAEVAPGRGVPGALG